jgi:hypothetical protein
VAASTPVSSPGVGAVDELDGAVSLDLPLSSPDEADVTIVGVQLDQVVAPVVDPAPAVVTVEAAALPGNRSSPVAQKRARSKRSWLPKPTDPVRRSKVWFSLRFFLNWDGTLTH